MRDRCSPTGHDVCRHISVNVIQILRPAVMRNSVALPACISMAASIRKLMFAHPSFTAMVPGSLQQDDPNHAVIGRMMRILPSFISVVEYINQSMRIEAAQSSSSGGDSDNQAASTSRSASHGKTPGSSSKLVDRGVGSRYTQSGAADSGPPLSPSQVLKLQLQSILMTSVVQFCHWKAGKVRRAGAYRREVVAALAPIIEDWQGLQHGLTELFNQLLSAQVMTLPQPQAEVGRLLGLFAVETFHGRLLPGCCHLGCVNLAGVSEAALPTLLCSGCRGARYCSVECQRAAWLEGGHGMVCKK